MSETSYVQTLKLCHGDGYKQVYAECADGTVSHRLGGGKNDEGSIKDLLIPNNFNKLKIELTEN